MSPERFNEKGKSARRWTLEFPSGRRLGFFRNRRKQIPEPMHRRPDFSRSAFGGEGFVASVSF